MTNTLSRTDMVAQRSAFDEVTITITTKNRWSDLRRLVGMLRDFGWEDMRMIVIDDGSSEALGESVMAPMKNCIVKRYDASVGQPARRNELVELASTKYVLSFDDDSCMLNADQLLPALAYMDREPSVAILAFPILERADAQPTSLEHPATQNPSIRLVKEFSGGGYIARRTSYLDAGGYRPYFRHMGEERDLAMRIYRNGQEVHLFPACPVWHWCSPAERNSERRSYYNARNFTLLWLLNAPRPLCWLYAAGTSMWLLARAFVINDYPLMIASGFLDGLKTYWAKRTEATRLSRTAFSKWSRLAHTVFVQNA